MTKPALPILRWMEERYGGKVSKLRDATERWAEAWRWRLIGKAASRFAESMRPLLCVKADQADLLAALARVHRRSAEADALKKQIHLLNRKGPDAEPAEARWVIPQESLLPEYREFSETWPRAGMTRSGTAYLLRPLAPLTGGTASGLLPTPVAKDDGKKPEAHMAMKRRMKGGPRKSITSLAVLARAGFEQPESEATERFPTPTAGDAKSTRNATANRSNPDSKRHHSGVTLTDFVTMEQFKTPTESDAKHGQGSVGRSASLCSQVNEQSGGRGALNPTWVEWLMGFPIGWTALPPSATPSSRRSRSGSAGASSTTREAA